jgi:hypothetical protein
MRINHTLTCHSALPILRQLGAQGGGSMIRGGDFSMLKVWVGLEARSFLQASIDTVSYLETSITTHNLPISGRTLREVRSIVTQHISSLATSCLRSLAIRGQGVMISFEHCT